MGCKEFEKINIMKREIDFIMQKIESINLIEKRIAKAFSDLNINFVIKELKNV